MKTETFIRIDQVGHWRGTEHVSSILGLGDDIEFYSRTIEGSNLYFENGISCYPLDAEGLADLYKYWITFASFDEKDAARSQVTIFKGARNGYGTDNEIVADCIETVAEFPAIIIYEKWMELKQRWFDDDETDADDVGEYIELHAEEFFRLINQAKGEYADEA